MHKVETGAGRRYKVRWREGGRNRARHFERLGDARAFDSEMRRRRQAGGLPILASNVSLGDYAERWLKDAKRTHAPRTLEVYAVQLDLRIEPMLGGYKLTEITPPVVRDFITGMERAKTGKPSIVKTCAVLQSILGQAATDGLIDRNPVALVRKPSQRRTREPDIIAPKVVEAIRAELGARDATLVSVLAYAGLRPESEAITLTWRQVGKQSLSIHATKTGKSRQVRLLAPLAEDLSAWGKRRRGLVFDHGGAWTRDDWRNWVRRVYRPAAIEAGLAKTTRPRDLRGSFASLLIAEGQSIVEVAAQLGHSPAMCLQSYAGVFAEYDPADRKSAESMIAEARNAS